MRIHTSFDRQVPPGGVTEVSDEEKEAKSSCGSEQVPCDGLLLLHKYKEDIVNSLECGLMVVDQNGLVIVFNNAAAEITGEEREEVLFSQASTHKTLSAMTSLIRDSFNKPTRRSEIRVETKSGEKKTLGISTYLMRHGGESVVGVIAVFSDLTHVKQAEKKSASPEQAHKEEKMAASTYYQRSGWEEGDRDGNRRPVILVADADASTRNFYTDVLEKAGCRVLVAKNGEEVVWKTFHEVVDVLVLDVEMENADAIDIVERLSKTNPDLPVVCTGSGKAEKANVLVYSNVIAYLPKPVSIFELKRTVAGGLETAAKKREMALGTG